jgi:hypothetical protein
MDPQLPILLIIDVICYIFEELVEVECVEGVDGVVEGGVGSVDGPV